MQGLTNGGWRILLTPDASDMPPGFRPTVAEIARRLADTSGRVTVVAQAPAPGLEPSFARRLSLERALSVKAALVGGGLDPTRIDLRPMGRQPGGADLIDVLPPGAAR
jgi:outer membrane protein OmpA-like peptidoglycan-associated protein